MRFQILSKGIMHLTLSSCKKLFKMKHLTIYLLCLLISPAFAQKSYRNVLNKDLGIHNSNINDFVKANDLKKANSLSKTISRYSWDENAQDWFLNSSADVKYLANNETQEIVEYDAQGMPFNKTEYFKSADGKISGNTQFTYQDGVWVPQTKFESEVDDANVEIRNEYFSWLQNNWVVQSGTKQIVERRTANEEIVVNLHFNENLNKYIPFKKSISTFNNSLLEQTIFQEYVQNQWVNKNAEGYDYDANQKISSVFYTTWDGVTFQNVELYTNIVWHDYKTEKFSQMELKTWNGTNWISSQKAVYQYLVNNSKIGITFDYKNNEWVYSYRISEEFDMLNNPKSFKIESYNENSWDVLAETKLEYTYDNSNRLIESIAKVFDGKKWYNLSKETIVYHTGATGINTNKHSLKLYPNPSVDYFMVQTAKTSAAEINIYNLSGQLVENIKSSDLSTEKINVSNLQKGMYIVEVKQGSELYSSKLLIN